ncbi:SH3 domain-containing protein [Cecembia calidifontis]|uniref:SH3 domain-containing protein n=2 Tax=Cecembia calidifontis TaxID=1187080 RepID=A0A4Q7PBU7_9BACT|nr:SH3 domain-containing protein [Cecembia calidifontis]
MITMKKYFSLLIFSFAVMLISAQLNAQTLYVNSSGGANLRNGPGTNNTVVTTIPQNGQVRVVSKEGSWTKVQYNGNTGYISSSLLSENPTRSSNNSQSSSGNRSSSSQSRSGNSRSYSGSGYTTAIGLRGGFTSGISFKHFTNPNGAIELVLGSRWHGLSLSGMYQWHKPGAFGVPELSWVYGLGARIGFYDGYYYYYHPKRGRCRDPWDPRCDRYYYNRNFTAVGLLGIGGLEYQFREIPISISLDLIPHFYFNHRGRSFMDGSVSVRYIIK